MELQERAAVSYTHLDQAIANIKQICAIAEIPVMVAGNINRMEDVKKLLYAGCAKVVLNFSKESNLSLIHIFIRAESFRPEAMNRF